MRTLPLALALSLAVSGASFAAVAKKKNESPPTAQPDSTLVAPDTTPVPSTTAAPTHPVEMAPIGSRTPTMAALTAVASQGQPAPAAAAPAQAAPPPPPASPPPPPPPPPAPPPLPPLPSVLQRAELCLRTEAPRAAKADASTKLAVDLLLDDLCGAEVDRASLYAHNLDALARFTPQSERSAAGLNGARVDPETGEILNPPAGDVSGALSSAGFNPGDLTVPPQMRRFAVELVIEARAEAHAVEPKKH